MHPFSGSARLPDRRWHRLFLYRKESLRTTWTFRIAVVAIVILVPFVTRGFWTPALAASLTCREHVAASDAILVDNFDQNYLLFERAAGLYNTGLSSRVLVPAVDDADADGPTVEQGIVEVMVRIAHLKTTERIPVHLVEPISLNVAYQIRDYLAREHIRSVMVVTTALRAKRALMIYDAVLGPADVTVSCVPVFGTVTAQTWTGTWHGIQDVALQFFKLQYYRFYVLPFASRADRSGSPTG